MACGIPDFLIIGAAKSGTTSLAYNLNLHPDIYIANGELHYFSKQWSRGNRWYMEHFKYPGKVQGEKSPTYLYDQECHQKMHRLLPGARLVIILRDPVTRALSNWNMRYNNKRLIYQGLYFNHQHKKADHLNSLDFTALVDYYLDHQKKNSDLFQQPLDIIHRGLYIMQIENLLKFYKRENLLILITEVFADNESKGYGDICRFLNVPPMKTEVFEKKREGHYKGSIPKSALEKLQEFYRPYNDRLFQLLGYRITKWEEEYDQGTIRNLLNNNE